MSKITWFGMRASTAALVALGLAACANGSNSEPFQSAPPQPVAAPNMPNAMPEAGNAPPPPVSTMDSPPAMPPEMMAPDVMEPDVMEPDVMAPDVTEPDVMEPDVMAPDVMEPDVMEPDVMEPDVMEPDVMEPDVMEPDVMEPMEELPAWATREDLGKGDGRDVVTIGDSWMSNTLLTGDAIEGALRRLTNQRYRNYGVQGVMLLSNSLFGAAIPTQFSSAVRTDPDIKTVIMTGGGNDIIQTPGLQDDCASGGQTCAKKLAEIAAGLEKLWADMAAAGVQDVIYMGYSSDAGRSGEQTTSAGKNGVVEICKAAPLNCHLIDSTPLVRGELIADGIHPARAANDRMAEAIYKLMEERGIRR